MPTLYALINAVFRVDGLTDVEDGQGNIIPAPWRLSDQQTSWLDYHPHCSNNFSNEARAIREEYMTYFNSDGAVPWQWELCGVWLHICILLLLTYILLVKYLAVHTMEDQILLSIC